MQTFFGSYNVRTFILLSFTAALIFQSCMSVKPGSVKSGKKYYETFFVGEEGTQYFIKPIKFNGNNDLEATFDFTYRYKNEIKDSANFNFTLISDKKVTEVAAVTFKENDSTVAAVVKNSNFLFAKAQGNKIHSRFSGKIPVINLAAFLKQEEFQIQVKNAAFDVNLQPTKKTDKIIRNLQKNLLSIM